MKKYYFKDLIKFLESKSLKIDHNFKENEYFFGLCSIEKANSDQITFLSNSKYSNFLKTTKAKACFVNKNDYKLLNPNCSGIVTEEPYKAYALTSNFLSPLITSNNLISQKSSINNSVKISNNVQINDNVIINENVSIGKNSILMDNSTIGPNVSIQENSIIMNNCTIIYSIIGRNCFIQSGAVVGGKGFGFTPDSKINIQHLGKVLIGDNVEIGSNTTIDRGALNDTIIGNNVRIDNLVQVAHNVHIGDNTIIASQVGIAGSTKIGKNCMIGGQAGFNGHIKIGDNVMVAAKSGVTKNIKDNSKIAGFPAIDIKKWRKIKIQEIKNNK